MIENVDMVESNDFIEVVEEVRVNRSFKEL